jgi:hypothetical protein
MRRLTGIVVLGRARPCLHGKPSTEKTVEA